MYVPKAMSLCNVTLIQIWNKRHRHRQIVSWRGASFVFFFVHFDLHTLPLIASLTGYGAPGPLFCGPKSKYPFTGYWDYGYMCDFPWKNPPQFCEDYPGQKGGQAVNDEPVPNGGNRTDVEGCCWWGRG